MSGHYDGDALVVELVEKVHDLVTGLDVDAGDGFVEEEEPRVTYEGSGEKGALLFTARELPNVPAGEVTDAEPGHDVLGVAHLPGCVPWKEGFAHGCAHQHDLANSYGEVPVDGLKLGDVADVGAFRAEGDAIDKDPARQEPCGPKDDAQDSALAGTTGPQEADEVARHDLKVHPGQDWLAVIPAGHVVEDDHRGAGCWARGTWVKQATSY